MFTKELESYHSLQINKVGLVLLDFKLLSILLDFPSSWRWSSEVFLVFSASDNLVLLRLWRDLRVGVQVCGKEQEPEEAHLGPAAAWTSGSPSMRTRRLRKASIYSTSTTEMSSPLLGAWA